MKRYFTIAIVTIFSIVTFISCKKDTPEFDSAFKAGTNLKTAVPAGVKGPVGIFWPDS
ncbi:MAG: hypothetical protein ABIQ31_04885 [Ferruginibacter sp.]